MKYPYEDMSSQQFERLIIFLCQNLLGISVQGFSDGPDGGRDAKFIGTAELHPSKALPWVGTVIIQAKHTNGYNKSFSEPDFYSRTGSGNTLSDEIVRIKKLREKNDLDHYMLFSNRRLAANTENEIRNHISDECAIPLESIYLCGVEQLEIFLKKFPDVPKLAKIDPIDSPLIVSPDEIADVVEALVEHKKLVTETFKAPQPKTPYEEKNKLNNMSTEYADQQRKRYLKDTGLVQSFLSLPGNYELLQRYETAVEEIQLGIVAKRNDYQSFDDVMQYLAKLLFDRDPVLRRNKRLTRVVLFFMYWSCDIGVSENAQAN